MMLLRLVFIATGALWLTTPAQAADPRRPDWPCAQIMVPSLSVTAFWSGPPVDQVGDAWRKDEAVADLVARIAARRTPLEDAEKAATDFVSGTPDEKQKKAAFLFAGLFTTLNDERKQVMDGIDRFAKRQQQLRDKIRTQIAEMRQHQDTQTQDSAEGDKLGEALAWDTRVYDERRHTIGYVCEVPVEIERRLFALARAIQQALQ